MKGSHVSPSARTGQLKHLCERNVSATKLIGGHPIVATESLAVRVGCAVPFCTCAFLVGDSGAVVCEVRVGAAPSAGRLPRIRIAGGALQTEPRLTATSRRVGAFLPGAARRATELEHACEFAIAP